MTNLKPRYFLPDTDTMLSSLLTTMLPSFYEPPQESPTWTDLGTVAHIAAETTAEARKIKGLHFYDGNLWLGYGDYSAGGTGPCDAIYWDGNSYESAFEDFASDSTANMRYAHGKLWIVAVDPQVQFGADVLVCTGTSCSAIATDPPHNIHTFDFLGHTDGTLYLCGSEPTADGAAIWRSTDSGATWTRVYTGTGIDRCFGLASLGGYLWSQGKVESPSSTTGALRSSDGITWSEQAFKIGSNSTYFSHPVTFADRIVFITIEQSANQAGGSIWSFDGTQAGAAENTPNLGGLGPDGWVGPALADGYLWLLRISTDGPGQVVYRTADLSTWTEVVEFSPGGGRSIEVYDGTIYVGTNDSKVYTATYDPGATTYLVDDTGAYLLDPGGNFLIA